MEIRNMASFFKMAEGREKWLGILRQWREVASDISNMGSIS